jgi:RNA polymerase sigma factor (sigma-70 family)
MPHDSDVDDAKLLQEGRIEVLLAKYERVILGRCIARLNGDLAAEDVAQNVLLRLLQEFHRAKSYGETPYRVVVHQVVTWTIADYFAGRATDMPLPDGWDPAGGQANDDGLARHDLRQLFASLPEGTRRVLEHRYLLGLEIEDIAEQLHMTRNAVDQQQSCGGSYSSVERSISKASLACPLDGFHGSRRK